MIMIDIAAIADKLEHFVPARHPARREGRRSAVTVLLHPFDELPAVLMIERAQREGDPWSGQMGFPGGRMGKDDDHAYGAAIRECAEEIGLDLHCHGHYLGRLSDLTTHIRQGIHGMYVTPFVFALETVPEMLPNHEVADIVWVPLAFLADPANRSSFLLERDDISFDAPCYDYEGRCIWGLSLAMLDELLRVAGLADFPQIPRPE